MDAFKTPVGPAGGGRSYPATRSPDPAPDRSHDISQSLDEGLFLPIGGLDQWVTIRGRDAANPVLMIVPGAGAGFSAMAPVFAPWEARFTLVQWDQPRGGATLARTPGDPQPLTFKRLARDGVAVAEAVLARLGSRRLALFASSGGTVTALQMIRARPDLFSAYVGNGQVTNWARQEQLSYRTILERARAAGDAAAVAEIEGVGPPPWADVAGDLVKGRYANAMTPAEQAAMAAAPMDQVRNPPPGARWVADVAPVADPYAASLEAYAAIRGELAAFDAEALGLAFDVPMVFLQGVQDAHTPAAEAEAYAAKVRAPHVRYVPIEEGGHMSMFLVERLAALMDEHVRPLVA
jgi:pimeloyl-ACP methyl ester carboxylesterase